MFEEESHCCDILGSQRLYLLCLKHRSVYVYFKAKEKIRKIRCSLLNYRFEGPPYIARGRFEVRVQFNEPPGQNLTTSLFLGNVSPLATTLDYSLLSSVLLFSHPALFPFSAIFSIISYIFSTRLIHYSERSHVTYV